MKKYISFLLAAVLCTSILTGCGGSGKSDQQKAGETQEKAVQSGKTEETAAKEDAARNSAQAAADTAANSGAYLVYVLDAETPLAEADIVIRPADGKAPDLDTEGKTKISFESLLREGRSKKIEELVKSIRQNVQEMIETAQEAASAA